MCFAWRLPLLLQALQGLEFRKPPSPSFVLGIPGGALAGESAADGLRAWVIEPGGKEVAAEVEIVARARGGGVGWLAVRGECAGERARLVLASAGRESDFLAGSGARPEPTARGSGSGLEARSDRWLSWRRAGAVLEVAGLGAELDGSPVAADPVAAPARRESSSPFHETVVRSCAAPLRAEVRATTWREGDLEVEVFLGNGLDRPARLSGAAVSLVFEPRPRALFLAGEPGRARPLPPSGARLESRGGEVLFLRDVARGTLDRIPSEPAGLALVGDTGSWLLAWERFDRREPAAIVVGLGSVSLVLLDGEHVVGPGQCAAARLRLRHDPRRLRAADSGAALARLARGNVAWLEPSAYRRAGALGLSPVPFDAGVNLPRLAIERAAVAWARSSRGAYGNGFLFDGDPPLSPGVPSNLEYDAVRAALFLGLESPSGPFEEARAAALHWRAADRGAGGLPWMHAREHAPLAREEGHVWLEGLLDLSYATDDRALREDLWGVGRALVAASEQPDGSLERTLAWPLLALCALAKFDPERFAPACTRYAEAILEREQPVAGVFRAGAREEEDGSFSWSPWLGGGLVGEALLQWHALAGERAARAAAERIGRALVDLGLDPRTSTFARRVGFLSSAAGPIGRAEGVLRGARNLVPLGFLARLEALGPDPRRAAAIRAVARSPEARVLGEPLGRAQWWTLAFRELSAFARIP